MISPNESDRNLEAANVVDGLFAIARGLNRLAEGCVCTGTGTSGGLGFYGAQTVTAVAKNCVAYDLQYGFQGGNGTTNANIYPTYFVNCLAHTCSVGFRSQNSNNNNSMLLMACGYYNCTTPLSAGLDTSMQFLGSGAQGAPLSCSVDPCTSASGGNFNLNNTANGGALLRAAGWNLVYGGNSTGYLDIGAVQSQAPAAGALIVNRGMYGGLT